MYQEIIFRPLYNGLVGIMDLIPWIDVGIAVIIFTVIVKFILYPLSKASLLTQVRMKEVEPEAAKIRTQYATDRQTQAMKIMELYREKRIKPFSGVLLLIIQLPILLALISVFYKIVPAIHPDLLYSFIHVPVLKTHFLGFIDLTEKSLILALLTGVIQFLQMHYSPAMRQMKKSTPVTSSPVPDMAAQMGSMTAYMKYFLPILAFASVYWIIPSKFPQAASIIAIYWATSTLFTLFQELFIRKKYL